MLYYHCHCLLGIKQKDDAAAGKNYSMMVKYRLWQYGQRKQSINDNQSQCVLSIMTPPKNEHQRMESSSIIYQ